MLQRDQQDKNGGDPPISPSPPESLFEVYRSGWILLAALAFLLLYQLLTEVFWGNGKNGAWGLAAAPVLGTILPLGMYLRHLRIPVVHGLGLGPLSVNQALAVVLIISGTLPVTYALSAWSTTWYPPVPEYEAVLQSLVPHDVGSFVAGLVAVGVTVPLAEEILFRFLVFGALERAIPAAFAIVLSGVLFGAAHMAPWILLPISFLGIVLCLLTYWTRTISASWLGHGLFNGFAFIELAWTQTTETTTMDKMSQTPLFFSGGLLLILLGFYWLRKNLPFTENDDDSTSNQE